MMPPRKKSAKQTSDTARLIERQVRLAENARFLRRLPGFGIERELPTHFNELLGNLHEAEKRERSRAQRPV